VCLNRNSEALLTIVEETARGAFYLFSGNVLATVLSAACGIAVARLLGPDLYGAYSLAFTIAGFLMVFTGLGVNSALTRYISHQYGSGGHGVLAVMIKTGTLFVTLESLLVYLLGYLFIKDLSAWLVNRPELADSALILLPIVVSQAIIAVSTGVLLGFRDAKRMAFISIAQQALRLLLAPLLVILGMGLTGALLGNTLAYIFSTVLAALYLYKYYLVVSGATGPRTRKALFEMIMYGAPLYASGVVFTLVDVYRNALLSRIASDYVVGSFNAAYRFVTLITIITTPISTALFPAFSRLSGSSNVEDLRRMFTISAKYTSLVVAPVTVFAATMSREFVAVLFGRGYLELTPRFFALAALNYLYVLLGHMVLGSFFSGVGRTRVNLDMMLIYSAVFALLAPALSSSHGADGLLYAIIVANGVSVIYALYIAYREYRVKLEYYSILGILTASLISAIPAFTLSTSLNVTGALLNLLKLVVSGLLFLLVYSTLLPLLRVVSKGDVEFVVDIFSSIKPLKPLVKLVAKYEEKLLSTRLVPYKPR
jgi:O-antigen/teichoic acid export membrane protein